jgi:GDSL-like Lipase/Acylhydrolase family
MGFRGSALVGVTVLAALLAGGSGSADSTAAPTRSNATALGWFAKPVQVNPGGDPAPARSAITARAGLLKWAVQDPPEVEFEATYKPPPARLAPSSTLTLAITVTGKLTGRMDVQGFRVFDVIPLLGDRWDGRTAVTVGQNCNDPIGAAPIACTPPASAKGTFTIRVPTPTKAGETFNFGVSALNCGGVCYVRYEYVARGQPTPAPKPEPSSPPGTLGIDYTMPDRFGMRGKDGLVEYQDAAEIDPDEWRVDFTVRRKDGRSCSTRDALTITAPKAIRVRVDGACRFHVVYRREGTYSVAVTLKAADGKKPSARRTFVVQDWLIIGLGDSNGSGEGAPEIPRRGTQPARWQNTQCHRSANSYQAQTARAIERRDSRTSVTFVHLACSGAKITAGLLGTYEGIEPGGRLPLRPQITQMRNLAAGREIDAVVVSVGVNDLGFGALVAHCIDYQGCASTPFPTKDSKETLAQVMAGRLAALPGLYDRLSRSLKKLGIPARRIFITEYFDSTRNEKGGFCNPLISVPGKGAFTRAEAKWAHDQVLVPLNAAVRAAAQKHGWRLVTGAAAGFRTHGYCSKDSWIVSLTESLLNQLNKEGTLHSTARGNTFQAGAVVNAMRREFYGGGRTRPPAVADG